MCFENNYVSARLAVRFYLLKYLVTVINRFILSLLQKHWFCFEVGLLKLSVWVYN